MSLGPATRFDRLLAKSTTEVREPHTLPGHTAMVAAAAVELVRHRGEASLVAAGVERARLAALERVVLLAALVHDLGKANDHFQEMVRYQRLDRPQLVRHEALTLFLCWPGQPLADWLRAAVLDEADYVTALVAAAGHHRVFDSHAVAPPDVGAGNRTTILTTHPDFGATLEVAAKKLDLPSPPTSMHDVAVESTRRVDPRRRLQEWQLDFERLVPHGSVCRRLLPLAKALVIDADVAGSILPRSGESPRWIGVQLGRRASRDDLEGVVRRRLGAAGALRPFQKTVAASEAPVTLVCAGCGTGKTLAAYAWAAAQHPGRQLWMTYPTTGTTTEGFRDYVHGAEVVARLEHSRAEVDLELFSLDEDGAEGPRELDRLDAIRGWGCEVVTATVDVVLGAVQNHRKGLYAWAGLCEAAIVFDEVHAYDGALFGALLRWLEALPGIPALLMTASLPADRRSALRELVHRVHGRPLVELEGPADLEILPRYLRVREEPTALVHRTLAEGGKVLWVSNTVKRCVAAARAWSAARPLIYHSRYRYGDRVKRHAEIIDAFRDQAPALALTTQVAEISLDLSADLLVTDLAPVPALIQRLGRLNRRSRPERPSPPRPFVVLPFKGEPYRFEALRAAERWLEFLPERPLSQRDLAAAWTAGAEPETLVPVASTWLDGGFVTEVGDLREATPGITVLLAEDAEQVRRGDVKPLEAALPMGPPPRRLAWKQWERIAWYPVAPGDAIAYDPRLGGRWLSE
jgi:CRISPR-associated endonuclease/helicase Cas3